jgi:predicted MFS family arabinose efflux permease
VVTTALLVFSAMTALCGAAGSYLHLLLARMGVSVGEAGLAPASHSIISDYFTDASRTRAIAVFSLGVPIGALLATFAGGAIAQALGWRAAFLALGVPGVLLAMLLWLTVKEPARSGSSLRVPSLLEVFRDLGGKPTYRHLLAGATVTALVSYSVGQYLTSFFVRAHELPIASAARYTGLALGLAGGVGTFGGGYLAEKLARHGRKVLALVPMSGLLAATPLYWLVFFSPSLAIVTIALMAGATLHYLTIAPMYAIGQGLAEARSRATSVAIILLSLNLLGYGLGPPLVGMMSDHLASSFVSSMPVGGTECSANSMLPACRLASATGLRYALALVSVLQIWAAYHFWRASKHILQDWRG